MVSPSSAPYPGKKVVKEREWGNRFAKE